CDNTTDSLRLFLLHRWLRIVCAEAVLLRRRRAYRLSALPQLLQYVARHALGELALAVEYLPRVLPAQKPGFFFAVRAQRDLHRRIEGAGGFYHLSHLHRVRRRDGQGGGTRDVRLHEHFGLGRIAEDRMDAPSAEPFDDFAILFSDDKRHALC